MNTVAITGASGYIGRHLVAQLTQLENVRIKVLARRQKQHPGAAQFGPGVEVVEGNLFAPDSLKGFLEPGCTVVHLAYLQGGGESENLFATANLLAACKEVGIRRLIHCSTAAVVGRVPDNIITEDTPCNPVSEYGITKLKIEKAVIDALDGSFDAGILRPTSVFGPEGGSLKKLIGNLTTRKTVRNYLKSCLFNKRRMNLVHVGNVVAAVIFMVGHEEKLSGGTFIVSEDDNARNNFADVERFLMDQLRLNAYPIQRVAIPLELLSFLLGQPVASTVITDSRERTMRHRRLSAGTSASAISVLLALLACGDAFGPQVGSQYALRSINGRALPTTLSAAPSADSQFAVYREAQYRVVSDSIIAYDLRVDLITRHADGSATSLAANCWDNYPYRYIRLGDSLLLTPAAREAVPAPPIRPAPQGGCVETARRATER